jgi:hypothetical protein
VGALYVLVKLLLEYIFFFLAIRVFPTLIIAFSKFILHSSFISIINLALKECVAKNLYECKSILYTARYKFSYLATHRFVSVLAAPAKVMSYWWTVVYIHTQGWCFVPYI